VPSDEQHDAAALTTVVDRLARLSSCPDCRLRRLDELGHLPGYRISARAISTEVSAIDGRSEAAWTRRKMVRAGFPQARSLVVGRTRQQRQQHRRQTMPPAERQFETAGGISTRCLGVNSRLKSRSRESWRALASLHTGGPSSTETLDDR
jgi:hypothetical protein